MARRRIANFSCDRARRGHGARHFGPETGSVLDDVSVAILAVMTKCELGQRIRPSYVTQHQLREAAQLWAVPVATVMSPDLVRDARVSIEPPIVVRLHQLRGR